MVAGTEGWQWNWAEESGYILKSQWDLIMDWIKDMRECPRRF